MAIVDELQDEPSEFDVVEQQIQQQEEELPSTPEVQVPEIPEKYRGKSLEDIVKMHQEAEKLVGRQAQEVGEVRKLADDLLRQQLTTKQQAKEVEAEIDFFENPKEAIRQAVERNPKVLAAEQYSLQAQREQAKQMLAQRHPDFGQIVHDSEFIDWVSSSKIRTQIFKQADSQNDIDAADELLSTFKQIKSLSAPKELPREVTEKRKQTLNSVSVDTGGTGETSKKIYKSIDLIRLKLRDPARYDANSDEIYQAYQDGRVR